jgi:hypothetical protein
MFDSGGQRRAPRQCAAGLLGCGPLASDHRADFERRLLALMRSELDACDESYPDGYGIGRFAILYEVLFPPTEDNELEPWAHSWSRSSRIDFAFSDKSYWAELALLREVLDQVEEDRSDERWDARHRRDEDGDEDEDEYGGEETST